MRMLIKNILLIALPPLFGLVLMGTQYGCGGDDDDDDDDYEKAYEAPSSPPAPATIPPGVKTGAQSGTFINQLPDGFGSEPANDIIIVQGGSPNAVVVNLTRDANVVSSPSEFQRCTHLVDFGLNECLVCTQDFIGAADGAVIWCDDGSGGWTSLSPGEAVTAVIPSPTPGDDNFCLMKSGSGSVSLECFDSDAPNSFLVDATVGFNNLWLTDSCVPGTAAVTAAVGVGSFVLALTPTGEICHGPIDGTAGAATLAFALASGQFSDVVCPEDPVSGDTDLCGATPGDGIDGAIITFAWPVPSVVPTGFTTFPVDGVPTGVGGQVIGGNTCFLTNSEVNNTVDESCFSTAGSRVSHTRQSLAQCAPYDCDYISDSQAVCSCLSGTIVIDRADGTDVP